MATDGAASYAAVQHDESEDAEETTPPILTPPSQSTDSPREERMRDPEEEDDDEEYAPFIEGRKELDDEGDDLDDPLSHEMDRTLEEKEESKSVLYLFILTLSIVGLQISWTTELSNGSPFLLSLGLSKSVLSFVWIAGPLMGVLVQPYVGILSDRSQSKWGRRRPFMVAGALATAVSFIALAWSREIIGGSLGIFGADPMSQGVKVTTIVWAVLWVYVLDFAINVVQAAIRAFIVDNAPTHQQEDANAWAGRLTGFGSILGYLSGYVDLPRRFPIFGDSQFKVLCVFASFSICTTVAISCAYIKERDPRLDGPPPVRERLTVVTFFKHSFRSMRRLPPQIRKVMEAQFFNWFGWFPFLFYITTYIGQLFVNPIFEAEPHLPPAEVDEWWEIATRVGSLALFINSVVAFISSIMIPILVVPSYRAVLPLQATAPASTMLTRYYAFLLRFRIPRFTLRRAWLGSHLFFAACMAGTFFATTPASGTVVVALLGMSWAVTMWAPFALISAEISKRDALRRARKQGATTRPRRTYHGVAISGESVAMGSRRDVRGDEDETDQAGVVLGLHNVSVSAPQILATLLSSGIFKLLQRDRGTAGDDSVGWVLRFGGIAALAAAFMTWRLKEEAEAPAEGAEARTEAV